MKKLLTFLSCLLLLSGCAYAPAQTARESFECMDTFMNVEICGGEETAAAVRAEIERLDGLLSASAEDSDIGRLNRAKSVTPDRTTYELLEKSLGACAELEGYLDISVYPLVEEWGFIGRDYRVPGQASIDRLLQSVSYQGVRLSARESEPPILYAEIGENMKIGLGAVAKGFAADRARSVMEADGVTSGILNLGGTVAAVGKKPSGAAWRVGICDPENTANYFGAVEASDQVIATSGSYERYFEENGRRYCHISDPKTGYPVDNGTVSVTVISDSGFQSDALSTALFVMGRENAERYWKDKGGFEFILLDDNEELWLTKGAAERFRLADGYDFPIHTIE